MSNSDSNRPPPQQARRRVLRKIAARSEGSSSAASDRPSHIPPDRPSYIPRDRPSVAPPDRSSSVPSSVPSEAPPAAGRTDSSDPFDLLASAARVSPALERMLERSSPGLYPPPAASSSGPLASSPQLPSFDSPGPATPAPSRRRGSLPPVVASVAEQQPAGDPVIQPVTSVRRAGLIGGALGLAFVVMFVVGARLAYRRAEPETPVQPSVAATAASLPPSTAAPLASTVAPASSAPELTVIIQSPKRLAPALRPAMSGSLGSRTVPSAGTAQPEGSGSSPAAAVSGRLIPPASANSSEAPENNPNPLVPVIPSAAAPELDPLVKAVLEDDRPSSK